MKTFSIVLLLLLGNTLFAQPSEYRSRGFRSYLVNYGAINRNRFLAEFAAKRFSLVDEGTSKDIEMMHRETPTLPILLYKDIVALNTTLFEYTEVNKDEYAFLHSSEPSGLIVRMNADTAFMHWLPDRRSPDIAGYRMYSLADSSGRRDLLRDTLLLNTNFTCIIPRGARWLVVSTVLKDSSELQYGAPVQSSTIANDFPAVLPKTIDVLRSATEVQIHIIVEQIHSFVPDSIAIVCDFNRDNRLDSVKERVKLLRSNGRWSFDTTLARAEHSNGAYEFYLNTFGGQKRYRFPSSGFYSTNVNNRIMNDYYGFYVMDVGSSVWRRAYIGRVLKYFSLYGYNGLFEDDCWYRVESWGVDAFPPSAYDEKTWIRNLYQFMDSIKISIAPRPAYFNGLYAASADSLLVHSDGGMTEGFAFTHWSGALTGDTWKSRCDIGLRTQHQFGKLWLALGGAGVRDPEARLYTLASYFLVADSLSMYGTATDYQEFAHYPEFDLSLGTPLTSAQTSVDELKQRYEPANIDYFVRRFERGIVVVNSHPTKAIVFPMPQSMAAVMVDTLLSTDGGRVFMIPAHDTIPPKQGRIFLIQQLASRIESPIIEDMRFTPNPAPADGATEVRLEAMIRENSTPDFRDNTNIPLFVTADLGELGGPRALRLWNDGSFAQGIPSKYSARFTIPVGAPPKGSDIPIAAYATTGLVTVAKKHLDVVSADTSNLVMNFSYEIDNDDDGLPDVWRSYGKGFFYDTIGVNRKSGRRSVDLKNDSLTESRGVYIPITLNQQSPQDMELSGWSKAINVSGAKNNDYSLYVDIRYQDGTPLYGQTAQFSTGTHDWEYASKIIRPTKPIKELSLYALFRNHTGGVWYDHIALRPYKDPTATMHEEKHRELQIKSISPQPLIHENHLLISFSISNAKAQATLELIDLHGKTITTFFDARLPEGTREVIGEIQDVPSGVYVLRLTNGNTSVQKKIVIMR